MSDATVWIIAIAVGLWGVKCGVEAAVSILLYRDKKSVAGKIDTLKREVGRLRDAPRRKSGVRVTGP